MKTKFSAILLLSALVAGFTSCDKDKGEDPTPVNPVNTPKGTFMFHLHTYIGENEVDLYNVPYATQAGREISLSIAQMYISDIQLVKLDGSVLDITGKKILKTFEGSTYVVGDVPVGNYKAIRFKVGLDAATNQLSPSASADSAMLNKPAMWFGSTAQPDGYVFMNVQGTIDTSANMSGMMAPFSFKIGTDANYTQVVMPDKNMSVVEDQVAFGHIMIDYSKLFTGIQLNQSGNLSVSTAAANSSAAAEAIVSNIPSMFIFEP
ncbi:MAG: MbnP family protein [Bacteroidia bacterium]|jgi:hypothetical protein